MRQLQEDPGALRAAQTASGWLLTSGHLIAKVIRFVLVGILSAVIYGVVTSLLVSGLGVLPVVASVAGYCASMPASFLGQRQFSFRANGHWTAEAIRFVVVQIFNISITAVAMYAAVGLFRSEYYWGMGVAVILVPLANFAFMNFWVFRDQTGRTVR